MLLQKLDIKPFYIEVTMELEYQFWIAIKEKNNVKTCRRGVHKAVIYDKCSICFLKKSPSKSFVTKYMLILDIQAYLIFLIYFSTFLS